MGKNKRGEDRVEGEEGEERKERRGKRGEDGEARRGRRGEERRRELLPEGRGEERIGT